MVIAEESGLQLSPLTKVYRYDIRSGSATFGKLIEVEGATLNTQRFPRALEVPIKETGYYLVGTVLPDLPTIYVNPFAPSSVGRVQGSDGKTPLNNAFVFSSSLVPTLPLHRQRTDDSGAYILRGVEGVSIRALLPNGTLFRGSAQPSPVYDNLLLPVLMSKPEPVSFAATNIVLLPDTIQMKVNEKRVENFLVLEAKQIQQVAVSGASFASLLPSGGGSYTLRLAPQSTDFGFFNLLVTATDMQGNSINRNVRILVTAPNKAPVITIPQNEYRVKVGETLSFTVTATDSDAEQKVSLSLNNGKPLVAPGNPASATYTFTPSPESVGLIPVTFSATDNGFGSLRTEKTIIIRVEGVAKPNEWTLISYRGLVGLLTDTEVYGELISIDSSGTPLNYIGGILYRSTFGEGVAYSTDKGTTWTGTAGLNVRKNIEFVGQVVGSEKLLMVEVGSTISSRVYTSINQGKDWTLLLSYMNGQNVLAGDNRGKLLVRGSDGQIYKAVSDGTTIKLILTNLSPSSNFKFIAAEGTKLYVAVDRPDVSEDKIFFSSDGGVNWSEVTTKFPVGDYKTIHVVGSRIFARTENGVFVSLDEGMNWSLLTGLPNATSAQYFASNDKYVFALLSDGRVYAFPLT